MQLESVASPQICGWIITICIFIALFIAHYCSSIKVKISIVLVAFCLIVFVGIYGTIIHHA